MRRVMVALGVSIVAAVPLRGQEAEVYAATANPGPAGAQASGFGIGFGGFLHLSDIFSSRNVLGRSEKRIGLRLSYARLRTRGLSEVQCVDVLGAQCYPPHEIDARLQLRQAVLVFEPYLGHRVSLDAGAGVINYNYSGERNRQTTGLLATLRAAARVTRGGPWWLLVEYERHSDSISSAPADGLTLTVPNHSLRAGVSYRAPLGMRPRPEH
ncbi:MAG TPA: hypothetical protein VKH19_16690 [Gemmatimonadaceae bacterium]|nr:hypothetical protein [Gemmatimonadaceae bacterium]